MEPRSLNISFKKPYEIRFITKSLRSMDIFLNSKVITDTELFIGNPDLLCITSISFDSPAIIINIKTEDINI